MVADAKITEFKSIINDASISDANTENLFDAAANTYNIFGCGVPIMTGTAGGKVVTYTSAQKGAVFQGARILYVSFYKNAANTPSTGVGSLSLTSADLMSNSGIWNMLKDIAAELKAQSATYPGIAFHVAHSTS
jgi:hypothetical protein